MSDITDHFSQFCISYPTINQVQPVAIKVRDYSNFSPENLNNELSQINWNSITSNASHDIDKIFSTFYNKFNSLVNKHLPRKKLSSCKAKQFSKLWITKGIRRLISYNQKQIISIRMYSNHSLALTRLSKKL